MRARDTEDVGAALQRLTDALFELQAVYEDSNKAGYTVEQTAYSDPQLDAQQAVIDAAHAVDAFVGMTAEFTADDGTTVALPNPELVRDADGLPAFPE